MATRHLLLILFISLGALLMVGACSQQARYRALTFFFDGVPTPMEVSTAAGADQEGEPAAEASPDRQTAGRSVVYAHEPFRNNKCAGCHDQRSGKLFRTPQEGLCRTCHTDVPGDVRYVHGPVAVRDCLFCHHPHTSRQPALLLAEPTALCLRCHGRADLTIGPHHETVDQQMCIACHDAHGGADQFLLKRSEP